MILLNYCNSKFNTRTIIFYCCILPSILLINCSIIYQKLTRNQANNYRDTDITANNNKIASSDFSTKNKFYLPIAETGHITFCLPTVTTHGVVTISPSSRVTVI